MTRQPRGQRRQQRAAGKGLSASLGISLAISLTACTGETAAPADSAPDAPLTRPAIAAEDIQSGYAFLTQETQRLQDDAFENPGFLWVERGAALFEAAQAASPACASCHTGIERSVVGAAARYPAWDHQLGTLLNLEGRINQCRIQYQGQPALAYESEDLLALTAYVASQSRGDPVSVTVTPEMQPALDWGARYFHQRKGQLDLACSQCHDDRWGQRLRGDTISQGHGNGFPTYRLTWQTLGSLHRRFRDCDLGIRAEPYALGSDEYVALELYLATRGEGLPVEAPSIRR